MELFFIIYFTAIFAASGQQDIHWIFGYESSIPTDSFKGLDMKFIDDTFTLTKFTIPFSQGPSAVLSDSKGDLIAYSNSCDIANAKHEIMPNGDELSPGHVHDNFCEGNLGRYPVTESGILLSTNDSIGYMLHIALSRQFKSDIIYQTRFELVDNQYEVTEKNRPLLDNDKFPFPGPFSSRIDACRHGNGRDWWVIVPDGKQGHFVSLFTNEGIDTFILQQTGIYTDEVWDLGQSVFSPDGTIYGRCDIPTQVQLMDFNRCDGTLSNARSLRLDIPTRLINAIGMAFSPNGRFLYVSTSIALVQFDLEADDVEASQVLVGEWDGFNPGLPVTFYQLRLAPNGKIYMSCTNGCRYLHVIDDPNKKGLACNFRQRGVKLPIMNAYEVPNIPNFSLGALPGSACDSLTSSDNLIGFVHVQAQPNPTLGSFSVEVPVSFVSNQFKVRLYSLTGRQCTAQNIEMKDSRIDLDISNFSSGIYILKIESYQGMYYSRVVKR